MAKTTPKPQEKGLIQKAVDVVEHAFHHEPEPKTLDAEEKKAQDKMLDDVKPIVAKPAVISEVTDGHRPELGVYSDDEHDEKALAGHPKFAKLKSQKEEK